MISSRIQILDPEDHSLLEKVEDSGLILWGRTYLFTERSPSCTLGLLVTLWEGSVAGTQPFTRGIIYLHGNALCGSFLWKGFQMYRLLIAQKVFKPVKQFREFPEESNQTLMSNQKHDAIILKYGYYYLMLGQNAATRDQFQRQRLFPASEALLLSICLLLVLQSALR